MTTDTPTPGSRAYEAYSAALPVRAGWTQAAWTSLDVRVQDAWEAAAQAAIAWWIATPLPDPVPAPQEEVPHG